VRHKIELGCQFTVNRSARLLSPHVVRFQQRKAPYNPLGRREQRRLLGLVLALGLVFLLMHHASRPESWHWFVLLSQQRQQGGQDGEIDTRLAMKSEAEALPGVFISPATEEEPAEPKGKYFEGVEEEYLRSVRDDTVFRGAEYDAFFHLLKILDDTEESTLQQASLGPTAFVQLYQQPDQYRGQLVSTKGTVHRVVEFPAARNDYGIEKYYQVWLQPHDAPGNPLVLYVLQLPEGFPVGMQVRETIACHGFFFKRWAYPAKDAIRSTPLLLARTLHWEKPVAAKPVAVTPLTIAGIISGALMIAGVTVWFALRGGQSPRPYASRSAARPSTFTPPEHDFKADPSS
jgi:hypothetical protein